MKNLKRYIVTKDSDVYAISLVETPAIEEDFIYLSKDEPQQILLQQDEKHLIIGAVLVPDRPIYRNDGGDGYYIQFSKETIEKLAYEYLMSGRMWETTQDHSSVADNVVVVESWIKTSDNDKSVDLGMHLPNGTWIAAMKVFNDDVWARIKAGELKGFSVEAFVNFEEINLSKNMENKVNLETIEVNETFWDKVKAIVADALKKEEEAVEPQEEIVEEAVAEIKEEAQADETPIEEVVELAEETPEEVEEPASEAEDELAKLREENEALKAEIEALKRQLEEKETAEAELSKQVEKLSKMPSTEPIKVEASKQSEHPSFLDFASGKIKF
jgi:hypothetical protein